MNYQMKPIDNDADGTHIIRFLFRHRKLYIIVAALSIIGGISISAMMKPRFNSFAILFPSQNQSIESVVDNPVFGYDIEADRLLQVLYSEEVLDSCAAKFDLYTVMQVDPNALTARDKLKDKFYGQVSFSRSQYVSIVISATTTDPQLSADMVNYIINLSDGIRNRLYKKNLSIVYLSLEKEYNERQNYLDLLTDSVTALRATTNIEVLTTMNNQVVLKSNNTVSSKEQTNLERTLNNYMFEQSRLNDLAERFRRAKTQYERPATHTFVLQYATPSYEQRSPNYIANTLVSLLCALVFLTGFLLLREKLKSINLRD
jgi:capsular polysaccharide biosynthesis protein